jgi:hypothetical protein
VTGSPRTSDGASRVRPSTSAISTGPFCARDATLSDFARDGINRLIDAGVWLTVASARGTAGMRSLLDGVRLQLPVIELNGAFVSDMHSGRYLDGRLGRGGMRSTGVSDPGRYGADVPARP